MNIPEKIAMGVFQFNLKQCEGDSAYAHRYCQQVIIPFLASIAKKKDYVVSMAIYGQALEFLDTHYASTLKLLRELSLAGQVEIISCMYSPALWVAYPIRDLKISVSVNIEIIRRLRLPESKIFLGPEGMFGRGLGCLYEYFDTAICSEEYVRAQVRGDVFPAYRLGSVVVVVGSNHISNELHKRNGGPDMRGLILRAGFHNDALAGLVNATGSAESQLALFRWGGAEGYWYHFGSAHAFTCPWGPTERSLFYADPDWISLNQAIFDRLLESGRRMVTVKELSRTVRAVELPDFPATTEGSWTPAVHRNVFAWMGRQSSEWEDHSGHLAAVWRSRRELCQSMLLIERLKLGSRYEDFQRKMSTAWRRQLLAESADGIGGRANIDELTAARGAAEAALQHAMSLSTELAVLSNEASSHPNDVRFRFGSSLDCEVVNCGESMALVGATGEIHCRRWAVDTIICEIVFKSVGTDCGICFHSRSDEVFYWPTGFGGAPARILVTEILAPHVFLPLANGLVSLSENQHIIQSNCAGQVAARISRLDNNILFITQGVPSGRKFRWRFVLIAGSIARALTLAGQINVQ